MGNEGIPSFPITFALPFGSHFTFEVFLLFLHATVLLRQSETSVRFLPGMFTSKHPAVPFTIQHVLPLLDLPGCLERVCGDLAGEAGALRDVSGLSAAPPKRCSNSVRHIGPAARSRL
jgi:hypothetical protein